MSIHPTYSVMQITERLFAQWTRKPWKADIHALGSFPGCCLQPVLLRFLWTNISAWSFSTKNVQNYLLETQRIRMWILLNLTCALTVQSRRRLWVVTVPLVPSLICSTHLLGKISVGSCLLNLSLWLPISFSISSREELVGLSKKEYTNNYYFLY